MAGPAPRSRLTGVEPSRGGSSDPASLFLHESLYAEYADRLGEDLASGSCGQSPVSPPGRAGSVCGEGVLRRCTLQACDERSGVRRKVRPQALERPPDEFIRVAHL